jgi:DNA topoisomerase-1
MRLLIVESPAKCRKIQGFLGPGWDVQASVGHIRDLPRKDLGVDLDTFRPTYEEINKPVIRKLRARARDANEVWLATDLDREGEAIAWHLEKVLGVRDAKRITFNAITEQAIKSAVAQPRRVDLKLVAAQEARRVADRLVGYRVSPALSDVAHDRLSAGRVQSVVVKLVHERDAAIRDFVPTDHYTVDLVFNDTSNWTARLDTGPFVTEDHPYITDRRMAETIAGVKAVKVVKNETRPRHQKAPGPFMTDTLQQAASVQLRLSTDRTMKAAQTLYEEGFITYHRTDYPNLSEEGRALTYQHLTELGFADSIPERPNLEKVPDGSQEAHEAIRPVDFSRATDGLDKACRALYQLIVERTLASQMKPAEYERTEIRLQGLGVEIDGESPHFKASAERLINPGWKALTPDDQAGEGDDEGNEAPTEALPRIDYGATLVNFTSAIRDQKTRPPKKFTEASILKLLKKKGIGRPSTYASIMRNIIDRGYVVLEKRKLTCTEKGTQVVSLLDRFEFMDYDFTRELEADLDRVATGRLQYRDVVAKLNATLDQNLATLKDAEVKVTNPCPECGRQVTRRKGKHGWFWSCTGYRAGCTFTATDCSGKMLLKEEANALRQKKKQRAETTHHLCSCGEGQLIRRPARKKDANGRTQYWYGCSRFPDCKATFFEVDGQPKMEQGRAPDTS